VNRPSFAGIPDELTGEKKGVETGREGHLQVIQIPLTVRKDVTPFSIAFDRI
jgi:hypothetical protein